MRNARRNHLPTWRERRPTTKYIREFGLYSKFPTGSSRWLHPCGGQLRSSGSPLLGQGIAAERISTPGRTVDAGSISSNSMALPVELGGGEMPVANHCPMATDAPDMLLPGPDGCRGPWRSVPPQPDSARTTTTAKPERIQGAATADL